MQLTQSAGMRMEQRQLLTPRMIQSMEILQMPLTALEERIDQELEKNPVLEVAEARVDRDELPRDDSVREENQALDLDTRDEASAEDFARLDRISDYLENEEFSPSYERTGGYDVHGPSTGSYAGERDAKLDAMNNTASRGASLDEHLLDQWSLIDHCSANAGKADNVCRAGRILIGYLDDRGYLPMSVAEVRDDALSRGRTSDVPEMADFDEAFKLIRRQLEPAGVGATSLSDCLLLQLDALANDVETAEGHDFELERQLVTTFLKDLEQNRYPQIAKKTGRSIATLQAAVKRLGRLHPHPGKLIAPDEAPPITPDATIRWDDDLKDYDVTMARDPAPDLQIRSLYKKLLRQSRNGTELNGHDEPADDDNEAVGEPLKNKDERKQLRDFLGNNVRNARWLIESIEQRRGTIERVIRKVLEHQRDFFDKGPEHLKPLPMIGVAEELGIHVATVSRAVSEKWIDTPRGLFPLRRFFSGGTTTEDGQDMSWDAVKEKLRAIIEREDKAKPLNDDEIVVKLDEQGIELARRTVAKYRKILGIPTARQRRTF
ncbi:MAG: RNA polymerase factor sigma-54 [Planctomycetota bacterium]